MAYTARDRLDEAAVFLNDANKTHFGFSVMLPFLKVALQELEDTLVQNSVSFVLKTSAVIPVAIGATTLNLPTDFLLPIDLSERATGAALWTDMGETTWKPDEVQTEYLRMWNWRDGDTINFLGATTTRDVKLQYYRSLTVVDVPDDSISISHVKQFLSGRSAALASAIIGENTSRAEALDGLAQAALQRALSIATKKNQSRPVRRQPFGASRRS